MAVRLQSLSSKQVFVLLFCSLSSSSSVLFYFIFFWMDSWSRCIFGELFPHGCKLAACGWVQKGPCGPFWTNTDEKKKKKKKENSMHTVRWGNHDSSFTSGERLTCGHYTTRITCSTVVHLPLSSLESHSSYLKGWSWNVSLHPFFFPP